jgi:hypothetical protein
MIIALSKPLTLIHCGKRCTKCSFTKLSQASSSENGTDKICGNLNCVRIEESIVRKVIGHLNRLGESQYTNIKQTKRPSNMHVITA